jgi:hypothetical protein
MIHRGKQDAAGVDLRDVITAEQFDAIRQESYRSAAHVVSKGRGPGSLESDETAGLDYYVMTASDVAARLPWLWSAYQGPIFARVQSLIGEPVRPGDEGDEACINVNDVRGIGGRYEAHTDSSPYTLLVFASSVPTGCGGELVLTLDRGHDLPPLELEYEPVMGRGVLFDGHAVPHAVRPLVGLDRRVSIPMVYYPVDNPVGRDAALDAHLYGDR